VAARFFYRQRVIQELVVEVSVNCGQYAGWPLEISSQACLPHMLSGYRVSFRIHPSWVAYRIGILKPMFHISSEAFESKTHCSLTQLIYLPKIFPLWLWLRLVLNCLFLPAAKPMTHLSNAVGAPIHFSCVSVFKIRQFISWRDVSSWGGVMARTLNIMTCCLNRVRWLSVIGLTILLCVLCSTCRGRLSFIPSTIGRPSITYNEFSVN